VNGVARFLVLWRINPAAIGASDPSKSLELNEKMFAAMDATIKKGECKEFGFFPDANSGYLIGEGEATTMFKNANMFLPYILAEVHEVIPYEKGKEILLALLKAQCAPAKK
jgi:hypothetical protein